MPKKQVNIVGAGFSGLCSAALLARKGYSVRVFERHMQAGGRARLYSKEGYHFDMGPSWYLMPEVFEKIFTLLGRKQEDYYSLRVLDPLYKIFFQEGQQELLIPHQREALGELFESIEEGAAHQLKRYLEDAEYKYQTALHHFLYRDYSDMFSFFHASLLQGLLRLNLFSSLSKHTRQYFRDQRLRQILEYSTLFLGNSPQKTPALYSMLSHADLSLGISFPMGGMNAIVQALEKICLEEGVEFSYGCDIEKIQVDQGRLEGLKIQGNDVIDIQNLIFSGDYAFAEENLLEDPWKSYSSHYWNKAQFAPSLFLLYVGLPYKVDHLSHHNVYFAQNWNKHFDDVFKRRELPFNPSFYLSAISRTDTSMAPAHGENIFVLVPIPARLDFSLSQMDSYKTHVIEHVEKSMNLSFSKASVLETYGPEDYYRDYRASHGTALGLAHTLFQSAVFRPRRRSKKVKGLFYTGHYTHPGVGVPMALISAYLTAEAFDNAFSSGEL